MDTTEDKLYNIKNKFNSIKTKPLVDIKTEPLVNFDTKENLISIKDNIENIKNKPITQKVIDKSFKTTKSAFDVVKNTTKKGINKVSPYINKGSQTIQGIFQNEQLKKFFNMLIYISLITIILVLILDVKFVNNKMKKIIRNLLYSLLIVFFINNIVEIILSTESTFVQVFILICIGASTFLFMKFIDDYITYRKEENTASPFLIEGLRNGNNSMVISQNPNNPNSILLYRSDNESNGIEFSYQTWIIVKSTNFNGEQDFKHIFHKGDSTGRISQCPSLWLHGDKNTIRIYINTINSKDTYLDIDNIPIDKWVHIAIVVKQTRVEIFINGQLKTTKTLSSLPRQNYGNIWVNLFGGFDGYISKLRYHRFALDPADIENYSKNKPNTSSCDIPGDKPNYLNKDWWLSSSSSSTD